MMPNEIEIEDYYGNTIGIVYIKEEVVEVKGELSIADWDTDEKVRIQIENDKFSY